MAEESAGEKSEDATPRRLRDAREKGDVPKSRDLTMILVLIAVFMAFSLSVSYISGELREFMKLSMLALARDNFDGLLFLNLGQQALFTLIKVLTPIFLSGFFVALGVDFLQVGGLFTTQPLVPNFEKLNPIEGFKNMFKAQTFIELAKNLAKLLLVFYLAYSTLKDFTQELMLSPQLELLQTVSMTGQIIKSFFIKVALVFLVIAIIDMMVQRWNYMKRHRMSKDEVKRDYKQDEGDPHVKGERKRQHREMVMGDVRKNVKRADAVVTNPIHVAVAILYDKDEMGAPEVLAKGQDAYAERIVALAREENVPVLQNVALAWSLLRVGEGEGIPPDLYEAVAEVLTLIYQMRAESVAGADSAEPPQKANPSTFNPFA